MEKADFERALPAVLPKLRTLLGRLVGHPDEAEDVLQEALLRATAGLDRFRGDAKVETWLYSIATRAGIDHLRARRRFRSKVMADACNPDARESMTGAYADPSISFDVGEHIAFCFSCIGRTLEPEESAALVLRDVLDLGNQESADAAGVSESVLRHQLSSARTRMQAEYDGLCALVNKEGTCHQCRVLREIAPAGREGPELPPPPLDFVDRVRLVRGARAKSSGYDKLRDYFYRTAIAMNEAPSP